MADDVVQEDDFDLYTDMICEESKLALEACRSLPTSVPLPVSPLGPSPDLKHLSPELKHLSPDLKPSSPDLKPPSSDLKPLSQDSKPQFLVPSKPPPEEESVDLYSDIIADYPRTEKSSSSDNKVLASSGAGLPSRAVSDGGAAARSGSSDKPGEEDSSLDLYTEILSDEVQQRHDSRIQLEQKYSTAVARIQDLEAELNKLKESEEKARTQNIVIKQNITSLLLTSKTELKRKDKEITRLNLLLAKRGGGNFRGNHTDVRKYNESLPSRQKVTRMSDEYTDGQTPRRGRNSEYDNQKRKRNEQVNDGTPKRRKVGNSKQPVTPEPKDRRKPWSHSQSPDKPDRKKPVLTQKGRRNDGKYSDQRRRECAEEGGNIGRSSTSRERDQRRRECAEEGGSVGRSSTSRERDQRRRDCPEEGGNIGRSSTSRERDQRRRDCAEEGGNIGRSSTSRERDQRRRDCAEEGGNVGRSSTSRERDQRQRDCAEEGGNIGRSSTSRETDQRRRDCAEEGGNIGRSSTSRERDHCDGSTSSISGAGQKKKYDRNSHERGKCHEIVDRDPVSGTKRSSKDGHGGEQSRMRNKSIDDDKEKKQKSSKQLQNSSVDLRTVLKRKRDGKGKEQKSVELANRKRHPSKTESTSESSNHTRHLLKTNDKEPRPCDKDSASAKISRKSNDNNFKADKPGNASKSDENLLKNNSVKAQTKYVAEAIMKLKPTSAEPQTDSDEAQDRWPGEKGRDSLPSASSCSVMKGDSSSSPTDSRGSSSSSASREKKRIRPIMLSGKPDVAGDSLDMDHKSCFDSVIQNIEMRENSSFANARVVVMDVTGCPVDASESTVSYENQINCKDGATRIRDDAKEKIDDEYDRTCIKNNHDLTPSKSSGQVSSSNDLDFKLAETSPLQSVSKDKEQIGRDENEQLLVCTGNPLLTETCVSVDRETMESVVGDMSDRDCSLDLIMEEERCSRTMPYIHVRRNKCRNEAEQLTCSNRDALSNKAGQGEDSMDVSSGKKKKSKKKHRPKHAEKENVLSDTEGRCADVTKSDLSGRISPVTTEVSSHTASASVRLEMKQSAEMAVTSSDTNDKKLSDNTHERKDAKIDHVDRRDPRLNYESGSEHSVKINITTFKLCQNSESVTNENNCVKIRSEAVSTDKLSFHQCEDAGDNGSHVDGPLPIHLVDSRLNGHERPPYHVEPFDFTSFPKSYARSESEDEEGRNFRNVECCGISEQRGVKKSCPENSLCDHGENAARDNDSDDIVMKEDECDENTEKKARHYSGSNDVEMEDTSTLSQMTKDLSGNVRQPLCRQSSVPAQGCNVQNVSIDLVKKRARNNSESQCSSSLPGSRPCSVPVECSQCTFQPVDLSVRSTVRSQFTESSHFRGFSMSEDGALDLSKKQIQRPFEHVNFESKSYGPKINPTLTNHDEPKSDQISSNTRMPVSSQRTISYSGCLDKKSSTLVDLRTTKSNVEATDACDLVLDRQIKVEKDVEDDSSQHQAPPQLTQDAAAAVEVKPSCQEQEEPASSDKPVNVSIQSMDRSDTSKECDLTSPERRDPHENKSDESSTFDSEGEEDVTPSTSQDLSEPSSKTVSLTQVSSCSDKLKTICSSETMTTISSVPSKTTTSSYDSSASADDDGDSVSSSEDDKHSSEDDKDSSEEDKESEEESSEDVCVTDNDDVYHCESSQSEILMKTLSCESLPLKNFEKLRHDLLLSDDSSLSYNHESSENLLATASRSHVSNDDEAMFKLPDMSTSAFARLASSSEPSNKTKSPETITRKPVTSLDEDTESSLLSLHAEQFEFDCDQSAHGDQFRSQDGQTTAETCVEEHEDGKSGDCSEDDKSDSGECSEDGEITSDEEGPAVEAPIDEELSVDLRELLKAKQLLEQKINGICGRESKKPLSSRTCDRQNRHKNQRHDRRLERKVDRSRSSRSVDNRRGSKPSTSEQERFSREVHGSDPRLVGRSSSRHRRDEEARYHSSPSARQIPSETKRDSHRNTSPLSSRSSHRDHSKENFKSHGSDRQDKYQRPDRMVTDTGRHRARGRDFTDSVRSRGDPSPVSRHSGRRSNRDKS